MLFIRTNSGFTNGDLYNQCQVDFFKEKIPYVPVVTGNNFENSEIITLGDSFFNSVLSSDVFASELGKYVQYKVHNIQNTGKYFAMEVDYPLAYFINRGSDNHKKRILILETVERFSLKRSGLYCGANRPDSPQSRFKRFYDNSDIEYFFQNNIVFNPVLRMIKNARFRIFGLVDGSIGAYSINPPMLFSEEDISFRNKVKSEPEIERMADNIGELSRMLETRFNIILVYVIIPDKLSVYRDKAGNEPPYNDFIPKVTSKIRQRGVKCIDLYSVYRNQRQHDDAMLYFGADTHFTPLGKKILAVECAREIDKIMKSEAAN